MSSDVANLENMLWNMREILSLGLGGNGDVAFVIHEADRGAFGPCYDGDKFSAARIKEYIREDYWPALQAWMLYERPKYRTATRNIPRVEHLPLPTPADEPLDDLVRECEANGVTFRLLPNNELDIISPSKIPGDLADAILRRSRDIKTLLQGKI